MLRQLVILLFALSCFASVSPSAHAATVEVAVTIKATDVKAREITVLYETKTWQKTIQLVVGPKAEITVDGKPGTLESLKPDQKATVLFDKELLVVTKIEVKGDGASPGGGKSSGSGTDKLTSEWTELFNGNDLGGWEVQFPSNEATKDGFTWSTDPERKVIRNSGTTNSWIATEKLYQDFWLHLEWRFIPGGKTSGNGGGVVVRSQGVHSFGYDPRGIQVRFSNEARHGQFIAFGSPLKSQDGEAFGEAQKQLAPLVEVKQKPVGQWNTFDILCKADKITVRMNGQIVNKGEGAKAEPGHICIRSQRTEFEFRGIRIRSAPDNEAEFK